MMINNRANSRWDLYLKLARKHSAVPGVRSIETKYVQLCWIFGPLLVVLNIYAPLYRHRTQMKRR